MPTSAPQSPNSDEKEFDDKRGTYVKGLNHQAPGLLAAGIFDKFRAALGEFDPKTKTYSGGTANFEDPPIIGAGRKLNGPQGAFARSITGRDPNEYGGDIVPPAPDLESPEYAVELVELYWASLLRDVPFAQYRSNDLVACAVTEMSRRKNHYAGPLDAHDNVTPDLLFRGGGARFGKGKNETWFKGEDIGPYLSQFCITPTNLGALPIDQKVKVYAPKVDYMTDFDLWFDVQRGVSPGPLSALSETKFLHDGRSLAAYTRVDELYQAYLVAYLVMMNTLNVPPNPGLPYGSLKAEQPFGTFGGPDIAATLGTVAKIALNVVWYQKWVVHLRHRPESGGGIVHMIKTNMIKTTKPELEPPLKLDSIVIDSDAVKRSYDRWGSYLLSQAFPEGSPTHPAYPTGHGTVAGACITVLKFFFEGNFVIANPMMPNDDGTSIVRYMGPDAGNVTVNGELHKLAHNISFGHGIHAGIHWRSDTDYSIALGEAVAIDFLQQQAKTYREKFAIEMTLINGEKCKIGN